MQQFAPIAHRLITAAAGTFRTSQISRPSVSARRLDSRSGIGVQMLGWPSSNASATPPMGFPIAHESTAGNDNRSNACATAAR